MGWDGMGWDGMGETYAMIRLEIVNLLLEEDGPEVFAQEFDDVEAVDEAGAVAGESGGRVVSSASVDCSSCSCAFKLKCPRKRFALQTRPFVRANNSDIPWHAGVVEDASISLSISISHSR